MTTTHALKGYKGLARADGKAIFGLGIGPLRELFLLLLPQLFLEFCDGLAIRGSASDTAIFECAAIEARAIVVIALANNFATTNNHAAMAVVQRGLGCLLKTKSQIVVGLHFVVGAIPKKRLLLSNGRVVKRESETCY